MMETRKSKYKITDKHKKVLNGMMEYFDDVFFN